MFGLALQAQGEEPDTLPAIRLYNTLSGELEPFESLKQEKVGMYHCGPTVYDYQHIGNLRPYVHDDVLRRLFEYYGYDVTQVINITDVGHLTSDADEGEDKMSAALRREGKELTLENMKALGERYAAGFIEDLEKLGIERPSKFPRASEHIEAQIALLKTLEEKGYAYRINDGLYFDTSRFEEYGKLGGIDTDALKAGARVPTNTRKRRPADFALWKFDEDIGWESPWGKGFPGWHLECSAMAISYLGKSFDIHTGGEDHIAIHHNNEIAQSESATGKPFARYWLHNAFITIEGRKIAKSVGNTIYLRNLTDRGISPLAYRYWLLTGHYRSPMNFTWEAAEAAQTALFRLHQQLVEGLSGGPTGEPDTAYRSNMLAAVADDLDTPKAIALIWELLKDTSIDKPTKRATLLDIDRVLGLGLSESYRRLANLLASGGERLSVKEAPKDIQDLLKEREKARQEKDFETADRLRDEIAQQGYTIVDAPDGPQLHKAS